MKMRICSVTHSYIKVICNNEKIKSDLTSDKIQDLDLDAGQLCENFEQNRPKNIECGSYREGPLANEGLCKNLVNGTQGKEILIVICEFVTNVDKLFPIL